MQRVRNHAAAFMAACAVGIGGGTAQAGVIDLLGLSGNAHADVFTPLRFSESDDEGGTFRLLIARGWAAGVPGVGLLPDADNILIVGDGDTVFFALPAIGETLAEATVLRATEFEGATDQYQPGEIVFSNDDAPVSNDDAPGSRDDAPVSNDDASDSNASTFHIQSGFDSLGLIISNKIHGDFRNKIHGDFRISYVVAPLPAALPLMAAGLGAFGFMGWRRRRSA